MKIEGLWKKLAVILLAVLLVYAYTDAPWAEEMEPARTNEEVAIGLFDDYGFTFMILALLLAAAMIGGIYMAKMPREFGRYMKRGKVVERRHKLKPPRSDYGGGY